MTRTIPFDPGTPKERHFIRIRLKLRSIDHQDRSLQRFLILDAQINLMTDFFQGSFQLIIDKSADRFYRTVSVPEEAISGADRNDSFLPADAGDA